MSACSGSGNVAGGEPDEHFGVSVGGIVVHDQVHVQFG